MSGYSRRPVKNRTVRRRRVQQRSLAERDFFDPGKNDVSHHSLKRMRRYRIRRILWFFQIALFLCLGLCIPYVAKWGYTRVFYQNDQLLLKKLEVNTTGVISEAEIVELSQVRRGTSLLRLDLEEIKSRIQAVPEIEEVEVVRTLPDSLSIQITERIAMAWLSCPDHQLKPLRNGGLLIDKNSIAYPCRQLTDQLALLPTIEIHGIERPLIGESLKSFLVSEALGLIEISRTTSNNQLSEVRDIRTLGSWGLLCRYGDDLLVTFDLNRIEGGLADLSKIVDRAADAKLSLATVNLVPTKNIPVTFHSRTVPEKW